ncbi:hypothetical protein C8A03DRAFT_18559, partial [Achaetomium macrosporum]
HETVWVRNVDDDVQSNVRKGLDNRSRLLPGFRTAGLSRASRSSSIAGAMWSSREIAAPLPPSKRPCSMSPTKAGSDALLNRVYRRAIHFDCGLPGGLSREALLAALADCNEGHESLRPQPGLLHRDISIGNLIVSMDAR